MCRSRQTCVILAAFIVCVYTYKHACARGVGIIAKYLWSDIEVIVGIHHVNPLVDRAAVDSVRHWRADQLARDGEPKQSVGTDRYLRADPRHPHRNTSV